MQMELAGSSIMPKIKRVPVADFVNWIIAACKIFWLNPLKLLLVSFSFLAGFILILGLGDYFYASTYGSMIAAFMISLIFPVTLSAITIANQQYEQYNQISFRNVYRKIIQLANLRLVLVYVLLVMFCAFGYNYAFSLLEIDNPVLNYGVQGIFILLQFIILLAIPGNLYLQKEMKPFHLLFVSLKAMLINIIPSVIFIVVVFLVLIIAILIAKYLAVLIGKIAILFYLVELWIFITWLSLCAITMTRSILHFD